MSRDISHITSGNSRPGIFGNGTSRETLIATSLKKQLKVFSGKVYRTIEVFIVFCNILLFFHFIIISLLAVSLIIPRLVKINYSDNTELK